MTQRTLFPLDTNTVVNVSKVPHRSPFRFPGGKTWLVPHARLWLESLSNRPHTFIEPFAGGAIVGLTAAFERYVDHVMLVELDDQVASVWKTILGPNCKWLANQILSFNLTYENALEVIKRTPRSMREKAFQTLLKNRTYHGGILANGSGMIKHGESGRGISSRWYPRTIHDRILGINALKKSISFFEGDGLEVMREYAPRPHAVFFIDPPYTAGGKSAGKRLYRFCDVDHEELFQVASNLKGECLITYDDAPEVRALAEKHGFQYKLIAMQNTHLTKMTELVVSKNLNWLQ